MKAQVFSNWGMTLQDEFEKDVKIWVDSFDGIITTKADIKIFLQIEPNEVMGLNRYIKELDKNNAVDLILTYEEDLLNTCNKAKLLEYGTCWINKDEVPLKKLFKISTVCGDKEQAPGHKMRKKLWYKQMQIKTPTDFYIGRLGGVDNLNENKILIGPKIPMFDSMFHICIENSKKEYYFSEKLIDCLLAKSIPIYWGAKKIDNYFNIDGFYIVDSVDDIINVCNSLTEDDYINRLSVIEENYNKALNWIDYNKRLAEKIKENI